jgi:hypothetical protein
MFLRNFGRVSIFFLEEECNNRSRGGHSSVASKTQTFRSRSSVILGSPPSIDAGETEAIIRAPLLAAFGTPPLLNRMSISSGVAYRSATERHGGAVGHPSGRADGENPTVSRMFSSLVESGRGPIPRLRALDGSLREPVVAEWHCGMQQAILPCFHYGSRNAFSVGLSFRSQNVLLTLKQNVLYVKQNVT